MIGAAIIALLIVANGLFVAMEFVIVGSRYSRLEATSALGGRIARTLEGAQAQDRYVAVAQLGVTLASIGLGMYGEHKMAGWLEAPLAAIGIGGVGVHLVAIVAAVIVITYFHVVFGEMIPKAVALKGAEGLLVALWPVIRFFELLFRPFVWLLNVISQSLLSLFGLDRSEARYHTPRELASIARDSSEGGAIDPEQAEFIQNIVRLQARRADELMTPRRHVLSLDLEEAGDGDLGERILEAGPSRLPVTRGGLDHVSGVVHVKDVIRYRAETDRPLDAKALLRIVRPLPKVLANTDTATLLRSMRRHGTHMALVADEYGGVVGAVAFEDAIEEVVGEIHSEFEIDGPEAEGRRRRRWRIPGTMPIVRLGERFGWEFGETGARTLAGLFIERLRRVPEEGDTVELGDMLYRVETMDGLAVVEVCAEDRSPPEGETETRESA